MKIFGIVREIDNLGRYTLPSELVRVAKFKPGKAYEVDTTKLEISIKDEMIYIKKHDENKKDIVFVRTVDNLRRITLPREIINRFGWKMRVPGESEGTQLEILTEGEYIILREYKPGCIFCNSLVENKLHKDKLVCKNCIKELNK